MRCLAASPRLARIASGVIFGAVCLIGMMIPIQLAPGVIVDGRSVLLSMAGLFGGPVTGLIAGAIAGAYRVWLGGSGMVIGTTVIALGVALGFAFGIPTYGCGHLFDAENHWGKALHDNEGYQQVWDGMNYADRVKMPVLWLSWPLDAHFPLGCQAEHYRNTPGPRMVSLITKMGHSHPAGWNPPDSYAFAKSVVETGKPWGSSPSAKTESGTAIAVFHSTKPLTRAVLVSTTDKGFTGTRKWVETPAMAASGGGGTTVSAPLPAGTTAWYINAYADQLTLTSDYQEVR